MSTPAPIRFVSAAVLALTLVGMLAASTSAVDSTGELKFWSDYAAFQLDDESTDAYVEFYFEMKRSSFTFRSVDDMLRADVYTWVHISDMDGQPVDSVGGAFVSVVQDSTELADSNFTVFFARALVLPPGDYTARTVVVDLETKGSSEADYPIHIPRFHHDSLDLSQIQFGYDIVNTRGDTTVSPMDVLIKNGQKVYPDCRGLVGTGRPRLFFYSEVYNLDFDPARENSYEMAITLEPTDSGAVIPYSRQTLTKPGRSAVLASSVDMRDVPLGSYNLNLTVTDQATGQTVSSKKQFWRVAPPLDSLTPEEEQRVRDIIAYIARPEEMSRFERLNPVGKRNFWIKFWKDRDPTPGTPENEAKDEHMRRLNYANEKFSIGLSDNAGGWRTDMGRVYIVYGQPSHIERFPFTPERPAAEQWFYDHLAGQGQVYFLFVDENGYGDYNLVHSTARGERRDPFWEQQVNTGAFERTQ
ncbi:MAG: hypothetical protein Kow0074_20750 [Candidatus Zixiibacteriota bacterium]